LINLQLDAQILIYLHIIHLLKSSTCFEHCPAHLQEVYVAIVYVQLYIRNLLLFLCQFTIGWSYVIHWILHHFSRWQECCT